MPGWIYQWPERPADDPAIALGEALTDYLLAGRSKADIDQSGTDEQKDALRWLRALAGRALTIRGDEDRDEVMLGPLTEVGQGGQTLASTIRAVMFGPAEPTYDAGDDEVVRILIRLCRESLPMYLAKPRRNSEQLFSPLDRLESFKHDLPSSEQLLEAILEDEALCTLFPEANDKVSAAPVFGWRFNSISSDVSWSDGSGGTLNLTELPRSMVNSTLAALLLENAGIEQLATYAMQTVSAARDLAIGKQVSLRYVTGVDGITVGPGSTIGFGAGTLHPRSTDIEPVPVVRRASASLIVRHSFHRALEASYNCAGADIWKTSKYRQMVDKTHSALREAVTYVQLAILLASPDPNAPLVTGQTGQMLLNPLGRFGYSPGLGGGLLVTNTAPPIATRQLAASWFADLESLPNSVQLGARRLLSAASRQDPLDGFVDALICWENLFGSNQQEVSFKVCGSLAILLEPSDVDLRRTLFAELKDLYSLRSSLVHGSKSPAPSESSNLRSRATAVGILALRALFANPLLLNARTSDERGKLILLQLL